jgi:hypothetical protein
MFRLLLLLWKIEKVWVYITKGKRKSPNCPRDFAVILSPMLRILSEGNLMQMVEDNKNENT